MVAVAVVVDLVPEVWVAVRHRAAAVASSKSSPAMAAAEVPTASPVKDGPMWEPGPFPCEVSAAQAAVQAAVQAEMQEAQRGASLEQQACHEASLEQQACHEAQQWVPWAPLEWEQQAWPRQLRLSRARLSAPCWYLVSLQPSLAEEVAPAAAVELWVAWAHTALEMLSAERLAEVVVARATAILWPLVQLAAPWPSSLSSLQVAP